MLSLEAFCIAPELEFEPQLARYKALSRLPYYTHTPTRNRTQLY